VCHWCLTGVQVSEDLGTVGRVPHIDLNDAHGIKQLSVQISHSADSFFRSLLLEEPACGAIVVAESTTIGRSEFVKPFAGEVSVRITSGCTSPSRSFTATLRTPPPPSGNSVMEDLVFLLEPMGYATGVAPDRRIALPQVVQATGSGGRKSFRSPASTRALGGGLLGAA